MGGPFGDRDRDGSRVLRVDADLKGLSEPLVDAEHGHVAKPTSRSHLRATSVCTGVLRVRVV
jgi:hypothetical protein